MKLRHQIFLLLGLPLVCQLVFTCVLLQSFRNLEDAAKKEVVAKQIIASCQDVRYALVQYISLLGVRRYFNATDTDNARKMMDSIIREKLGVLDRLVKDEKEGRAIVEDYKDKLRHFRALVYDTNIAKDEDGIPEINLTSFVDHAEFMEEIMATINQIVADEQKLIAQYRPIEEALTPSTVRQRENMPVIVISAAALYTAMVMTLLLIFSARTMRRLKRLMENIKLFSKGSPQLQSVGGTDELSEIDSEFRNMAAARMQAEDLRRSLLAMVSHDLRSPLTSIGLSLSLIIEVDKDSLTPKVMKKLRKSDAEIQRLVRLADCLLEIERIESGKIELDLKKVSMNEIVESSYNAVVGIADSKEIEIISDHDRTAELNCDPERVIQVLVNLLSNAVKFAPVRSVIRINGRIVDDKALFEVIDQGPGVPDEDKDKLFLKFSQLEQDAQTKKVGSGLGLYISKTLIEAHGGNLGYRSPDEGGSCFYFEIKC